MKNQTGTMKNYENPPGTIKMTSRAQLEKVIIFRYRQTLFRHLKWVPTDLLDVLIEVCNHHVYNGHGDSVFDFAPLWGVTKNYSSGILFFNLCYFRASLNQLDHYFG